MFNRKGSDLPVSTIVVTIIALIVLATVGIMFFGQVGQTSGSVDQSQCMSKCQNLNAYYNQPGMGAPVKGADPISNHCAICKSSSCVVTLSNSSKYNINCNQGGDSISVSS